jgi:hypothetical protein
LRNPGILLAALCSLASLTCCSSGSAAPNARRIGFWKDVIASHRITGRDRVRVDSRTDASAAAFDGIDVQVEIGPAGDVLRAYVERDGNEGGADPEPAIAAVRQWRFRPFEFEGAPVVAVGSVHVEYEGPELWRQPGAKMPAIDYDRLSVMLERGPCLGPCPVYQVEIKGDGEVVFTGAGQLVDLAGVRMPAMDMNGVLVPGRHVSRIDRPALDALIARFRDAHFFGLKDVYEAEITDSASYVLTFQTGDRRKQVVDYVGDQVGMPGVVAELENEVDRVAGTRRWVKGDAATGAALASEGFDFSSDAAVSLLVEAMREAPEEFVLDLIARGVRLDREQPALLEPGQAETAAATRPPLGQLLLQQSVLFHRPAIFRELERRGWLGRTPIAILSRIFAEGGGGCDPAIAEGLVRAGADPAALDSKGKTALMTAFESYSCGFKRRSDLRPLVSTLIRLGVPLEAADKEGETALFKTDRLELVRLLLAAGARADVKDRNGRSPALSSWDDSVLLTLLEAGADPGGRNSENKTLRELARERHMPGTLAWLDAHHIR